MLNGTDQQEQKTDYKSTTFLGTVVNNLDPMKAERLQITVPNLLTGPVATLPWVMPKKHRETAVGIDVPNIGDQVYVELQDGDIHYPVWVGRHLVAGTLPTVLSTNYPNRSGWVDAAGNYFYVDRTPGQNVIALYHATGTTVVIDAQGNLTATVKGNINAQASGAGNVQVTGNLNLSSTGGNITLSTPNTLTLSATNLALNITGSSIFSGGGNVALP